MADSLHPGAGLLKRLVYAALALLALAAAGALYWLGGTEAGLHFAFSALAERLPGELGVASLRGRLFGRIELAGIAYRDESGLQLNVDRLRVGWSPVSMLWGTLHVSTLHGSGARIVLAPDKSDSGSPPAGFAFPFSIALDDGQVNGIDVLRGTQPLAQLKGVSLAGHARREQFEFRTLTVEMEALALRATGTLNTRKPFALRAGFSTRWTGLKTPLDARGTIGGDMNRLVLRAETPTPYSATLNGTLANLLDAPAWDATLMLDKVSPAYFIAAARMHDLSGAIRAAGNIGATNVDASLRATYEGPPAAPLLLDASLIADARGIAVRALDLRSRTNGLHARGELGDRLDLRVELDADDVGALLPAASGRVTGRARLRGTPAQPTGTITLTGTGLQYADYRAGRVNLNLRVDDWRRYAGRLVMDARAIGTRTAQLDSLDVRASGTAGGHTLSFTARRKKDSLRASLRAGMSGEILSGQIQSVTARLRDTTWQLEAPAAFRYGQGSVNVGEACFRLSTSALCGNFSRARDGAMAIRARTRNGSLALLKPLLPETLSISGKLDATAAATIGVDGKLDGELNAAAGAGRIRFGALTNGGDGETPIAHGGGRLAARARDGWLTAQLSLAPAPGSTIDGTWRVPIQAKGTIARDAPVSGTLRAHIAELGLIEPFFPEISAPKGNFTADLRFGGTVAVPRVAGAASLDNGALGIPRLGIRLDPLRARFTGTEDGTLRLKAEARSGGALNLDGEVLLTTPTKPRARLTITGKDFVAARLPGIEVTVAPNLRMDAEPGMARVTGEVFVPRGRITGRDLRTAQTASSDVVIVGRDEEPRPASTLAVGADINVRIGDGVRVNVAGVTGWVSGALAIRQPSGGEATGVGELEIRDGRYEGYGQKLEITRGRLVFAGGPVRDPRLDVRAVRRIDEVTAGIAVGGTVSDPRATLFSEPAMSDTDALSYIMLGRPASTASRSEGSALAGAATSLGLVGGEFLAQKIGTRFGLDDVRVEDTGTAGTTSLVLGRYLTPRLYVQYGLGLFEPVNTLKLRYQLGKKWRVETESGKSQGGDLLYSIER